MKAMQLVEARPIKDSPLKMADLPEPHPEREEVRIKVRSCGVCHTDLHTVEGELHLPKLPVVPGHEVVGVVDELGDETSGFEEGDRVGVTWLHSSCGECKFCRKGMENLCEDSKFTGLHVDGGYQEFMTAKDDFIHPVPKNFSDEEVAPLLCAGVIGYRALRLSDLKLGEKLGLFGFGASAHIVIQVAIDMGCEVYVFSRDEEHRRLARKLGSKWEGSSKDDPPHKIDGAITFAPVGWIVKDALRVLDKGGSLVVNAIHMTSIPELNYDLIYHERTIRSVANVTRKDAEEFLKIAGEIPIKTEVEVFPLEEANRVLQLLKESRIDGAATLRVC